MEEKNSIIIYKGNQIELFSDSKNNDYVNITSAAKASGNRKSILSWIRSRQTIEFLDVWERKHNTNYDGAQLSTVYKLIRERNFSIKNWIDLTGAKGIYTRIGEFAGTYAHRDIAIKFAGWLSADLELYLIEEIQRLKDLERQKNSFELLSQDQILSLVRLKEVFKYVAHQEMVEDAHKDFFAAQSKAPNPFAEFNNWRSEILGISKQVIDDRIKQYCVNNKISLTTKLLSRTKRDKILILDSYEAVKIAVWDFLMIEGNVNALNLATLVEKMIRIEKGEILRKNETDLFHTKQDFGEFKDFEQILNNIPKIKTARQVLEYRKQLESNKKNKTTQLDKTLGALLKVPPPSKEK